MSTSGTNITALAKPAVGTTAGPQWATDLNTSIDAVDGHDHSTNKGIRITPAAVNINADLEFNQNSASELKNIIFDSSVTAATTSYSVYQASGNLYWRNGSGTAVQITTAGAVNAGAGSISGMTGTDAGVSYADGSKTFNFFTDSGNEDYGKMAHADLLLFKYTNDNTGDTDYVTIAANSGVSGSSGTIYVPSENGTFLTTATSYAGAISIATSASNGNIALNTHGTGEIVIGNGSASGKITTSGAHDLVLDTNAGSASSSITITDAANGNIILQPQGTGDVVIDNISIGDNEIISTFGDINMIPNGSSKVNISGNWTAASQTCANLGTVTTTGTIGLGGKLTAGSTEIEGSNFDINGGTIDGCTITGNIIGNASGTAATVTGAAQSAITSVGTLTALTGGTGDFNWDSNTLVVDSSESRVGIGIVAPGKLFHISGSVDDGTLEGIQLDNTDWASTETGQAIAINMRLKQDSTMRDAGRITVGKDDDWDDAAATDSHMTFKTTLSNTLTERMRIDSSGNVGIGTDSPTNYYADYDNLVIASSAHTGMTIVAGTTSKSSIAFADGTSGADQYRGEITYDHSSEKLNFATFGSARMIIESDGHVTIPDLDTTGSATNRYPLYWVHTGATGELQPYTGSVREMKKNIADMPSVSWVHDLALRSFNWRDYTDTFDDDNIKTRNYLETTINDPKIDYGLVADEVDLIDGSEHIVDKDADGNLKGILYHNLIPILLKAIQELGAKNNALEARIFTLENA